VDDLWATKGEDVGLIVRAIRFQDFQPDPPMLQTDRRTDGRTDKRSETDDMRS